MIPKECKSLAESDFLIAVVSKNSARKKSIRHGHRPYFTSAESMARGKKLRFRREGSHAEN